MKILLAVVGGLLLLIFPFIVMKKAKVVNKKFIGKLIVNAIIKAANTTESLRPNFCGTSVFKDLIINGSASKAVIIAVIFI